MDRGEVNDDGEVLVRASGVPPNMLINTNNFYADEAVRVINQHPPPFCQDGFVRGIPGDPESFSDPSYGEVLAHDSFQGPG